MIRTPRLKLLPLALLSALAVMAYAAPSDVCGGQLGPQGDGSKPRCDDHQGKSDPAPKPGAGDKGGMPTPAPKMPPLI